MIWETTFKDKRNWLKKALTEKKITQEYYDSKMKALCEESENWVNQSLSCLGADPQSKRKWLEEARKDKEITQEHYERKMKDLHEEFEKWAEKNLYYPCYSTKQFALIPWRTSQMDVNYYIGKFWQCADCGTMNKLWSNSVFLEGKGMRIILKCSCCEKYSIVRVKGFLRPRLVTEAKLAQELNSHLEEGFMHFHKCKLCGKETSKSGNLTNMMLIGIENPILFQDEYGMMCEEHCSELTMKIMEEKGLSESDLTRAMARAREIMVIELHIMSSGRF